MERLEVRLDGGELFDREELRERLAAPLDEERAGAYQQGFEDALRAVAVAFGVWAPGAT